MIDGSCKGGYNALMEARDYILMGGCELHREQTRQILMEANVLDEEAECILTDQQLSNYMRYNLIKNMVRLEYLRSKEWCSASVIQDYGSLCTTFIF